MPDYVPRSDPDFTDFVDNYAAYIAAHQAELGLSVGQVADYTTKHTDWGTKRQTHLDAADTEAAARTDKDASRTDLEAYTRVLTRFMQNNPDMTDHHREQLRITIPDRVRTEVPPDLVLTTPAPSIHLEWGVRGQCTIHWGLSPTNENLNAKPEGIHSARIEYCYGGIPTDESQWQFLAEDTNSPYIHSLGTDAPTKVGYRAQWVDVRERRGPYGEAVDVTISD